MIPLLRGLLRFLLFLIAMACAGAALAAQGGVFSDRLDALAHGAPFYLAGGLAAAVIWALLVRRGFITIALAVVAITSSGLLIAPELVARRQPAVEPGAPTIRIVQFNLWGRKSDPEGAAAWILAQDADAIVMEEAFARSGGVVRALAKDYPFKVTCVDPEPCSTVILTKRRPLAKGGLGRKATGSLVGAWVTLPGPGGPFTVFGVHLTWPWPAGPQQQMTRRLARIMSVHPRETTILAGDFNSTPWSFSLRRQDELLGLERRTRALPSWPAAEFSRYRLKSPFPVLPIDHVYAGSAWRTVSVERGPRLGSDHFPIVVTLARVGPSAPAAPSKAVR